jgi:hypothetical protein
MPRTLEEAQEYWQKAAENYEQKRSSKLAVAQKISSYEEELSQMRWYTKLYWWCRMKWGQFRIRSR